MNELQLKKLKELWVRTRRGVMYGLLLLLFLLLQNVVFSHIAPLGVRSMFLPALVVAAGLFEGGDRGGYFGLAAGVLSDLLYTSHGVTFTLLFPLLGFAAGFLADFYLNRRFFSYAVLAVLGLFLSAFFQMFGLLFFQGQSPWALWSTALLQTLWSVPFIFPAYYLCKMLPRKPVDKSPSPYSRYTPD